MISVIIPAHNEEKVIAAPLKELAPGVTGGELEVIVVCNGCSDNTAGVIASFGGLIKSIETPVPSKTNALNLGDAQAKGFPRIYQDADVVLSLESARKLARTLQSGAFMAASPKMRMDLHSASWPVRGYYEVWQSLSYVREGMIGTGVFALSEAGRKRFDHFPEVIADDGYIRALFRSHERISVNDCFSLVRAPATLNGLLKIKTRSRLGRYQLKTKFPDLLTNEEKEYYKAVLELIRQVHLWPKLAVYLYVNLVSRFRARNHARKLGFTGWERDDSSRYVI